MATSVKVAKLTAVFEVIESLSATNLSGTTSSAAEKVNKINKVREMTSGTTPDAEVVYMGTEALTAGTATIDLKALTNSEGDTIVTEAKKVRAIFMGATSSNTAAITLTEGASNGYELGGDGWKLALTDEQWAIIYLGSDAPAVGDSTKNIDISGTGTESVKLLIVFG